MKTYREEVKFEESREEDKNTSSKDDPEETKFEKSEINERREKNDQEPVVALRGKVSVGGADRVNTESSAVKGQSDEDVRGKDVREMRRIESTDWPRASTAYETFRYGTNRSQSSGEAGTGDRRNVIDSSEKGSKIDGGAQRLMGLRSEAELQGAKTATLGSDKSAEIWGDRVVTDGISRPMVTDGKGRSTRP